MQLRQNMVTFINHEQRRLSDIVKGGTRIKMNSFRTSKAETSLAESTRFEQMTAQRSRMYFLSTFRLSDVRGPIKLGNW